MKEGEGEGKRGKGGKGGEGGKDSHSKNPAYNS